jgi:hypothetical protein
LAQDAAEPTTSASTQPAPLETLREDSRQRLLATVNNLSSLPARKVGDLIHLRVADGLFALECSVQDTGGVHKIDLADAPGITQINAGVQPQTASTWVDFQHTEFATPFAISTLLQFFSRDDYMQIAYDFTGATEEYRVQLIQAPSMAENPSEIIRIYVERFNAINEDLIERVQISGRSFDELMASHRGAALKYLVKPLASRTLHRDVLAVPKERAWLVLGGNEAQAEVAARVNELVKQLDAEKFTDRRAAALELSGLGPPGALALRKVDHAKLSEEQRQAIETVLRSYTEVSAQQTNELSRDPLFLIGVLYSNEQALWPAAAKGLAAINPGYNVALDDRESSLREADKVLLKVIDKEAPTTQPATRPAE